MSNWCVYIYAPIVEITTDYHLLISTPITGIFIIYSVRI